MKTVEDVWTSIDKVATARNPEPVATRAALGRRLAKTIYAPENLPAFDRSAMDGFLVALDCPCGVRVPIVGEIAAGSSPICPDSRTALRLSTGSAIPSGPFAVVRREDVREETDGIVLLAKPDDRFIRRAGSHVEIGKPILPADTVLDPAAIALLASLGITTVSVSPRISVTHITTGSEIAPEGSSPPPGKIRDANGPLLAALVETYGGRLARHSHVGEEADALRTQMEDVSDLVLISGGVSVGHRDNTRSALEEAGFEILIAGVNVRPGRPLLMARRGATIAFGLPGNPLSHFVCFHLFIRRALSRLSGSLPPTTVRVGLNNPDANIIRDARVTWWPAQCSPFQSLPLATPLAWADSSDLCQLPQADGLVRIPARDEIRDITSLDFLPL